MTGSAATLVASWTLLCCKNFGLGEEEEVKEEDHEKVGPRATPRRMTGSAATLVASWTFLLNLRLGRRGGGPGGGS